jgi:hypothetical protein
MEKQLENGKGALGKAAAASPSRGNTWVGYLPRTTSHHAQNQKL